MRCLEKQRPLHNHRNFAEAESKRERLDNDRKSECSENVGYPGYPAICYKGLYTWLVFTRDYIHGWYSQGLRPSKVTSLDSLGKPDVWV